MNSCPILDKYHISEDNAGQGKEVCLKCPMEICALDNTSPHSKREARQLAKGMIVAPIGKIMLTDYEREKRDKRIIADYSNGLIGQSLADKHNVTKSWAYSIIRKNRETGH